MNTSNSVMEINTRDTFDFNFCPYTDVYIALYTPCFPSVCGKNFTQATRAGFEPTTSWVTHFEAIAVCDIPYSRKFSVVLQNIKIQRPIYTTQKKIRVKGNLLIIFVSTV